MLAGLLKASVSDGMQWTRKAAVIEGLTREDYILDVSRRVLSKRGKYNSIAQSSAVPTTNTLHTSCLPVWLKPGNEASLSRNDYQLIACQACKAWWITGKWTQDASSAILSSLTINSLQSVIFLCDTEEFHPSLIPSWDQEASNYEITAPKITGKMKSARGVATPSMGGWRDRRSSHRLWRGATPFHEHSLEMTMCEALK
ncbi:hypothetical protein BU17DRAFT_61513 [Hysterangium stoloniferum]|nr:hypothetical protein BU17DRAFT_61513 [Hysterangium stoloniferum]